MASKEEEKKSVLTPVFRQYKPMDVYLGAKITEMRNVVSDQKEVVTQRVELRMLKTGNEAFDIWLENMAVHGFKNRTFHARLLGIEVGPLSGLVWGLTGMLYGDFVRQLTYVVAKDLIRNRHYRYLNQVTAFLGYKSYSSLFRLMREYE